TLASSANPSVFGQPVKVTATVAPVPSGSGTPTGTVTLFDGATQIGSGSLVGGSFAVTTASMSVASHAITAVYGGDANFLASSSAALNQIVNRAPTAIGLVANPSGPAT